MSKNKKWQADFILESSQGVHGDKKLFSKERFSKTKQIYIDAMSIELVEYLYTVFRSQIVLDAPHSAAYFTLNVKLSLKFGSSVFLWTLVSYFFFLSGSR